uniref:Putative sjchgc07294 protein n=1 Tax=Ixodes ricinus TaxID=34613 RepID=A0A147BVN1_IXORI
MWTAFAVSFMKMFKFTSISSVTPLCLLFFSLGNVAGISLHFPLMCRTMFIAILNTGDSQAMTGIVSNFCFPFIILGHHRNNSYSLACEATLHITRIRQGRKQYATYLCAN